MTLGVSLRRNDPIMDSGQEYRGSPFYEELEMLALQHRPCEIVYRSGNGARTVIRIRIARLYAGEGREWLETAERLVIGLDQVEQVDGRAPSDRC